MKNIFVVTVDIGQRTPDSAKQYMEKVREETRAKMPDGTIVLVFPLGTSTQTYELRENDD